MSDFDPRETVRAIHNSVAHSADDVEASTRPPRTPRGELRRMTKDVLAKLDLRPGMSVLEIGCGTGLLAAPVARVSGRFVGLDFADRALEVTARRLHDEGLDAHAEVVCLDFLAASPDELAALGVFDRVLVYSVLHYSPDDEQARAFVEHALQLVRPGGLALFGNLPLRELVDEERSLRDGTFPARLRKRLRWLATNTTPLPRTTRWKVKGIVYRAWLQAYLAAGRGRRFTPGTIPAGALVTLSVAKIETWLAAMPAVRSHRWEVPRVGTPMFVPRGDLLVRA